MEAKQIAAPHMIVVENRRKVSVSGVTDVDSFDEQTVALVTSCGELVITGIGLHISRIDVESGDLMLEGEIYGVAYSDNTSQGGGLFSRIFR